MLPSRSWFSRFIALALALAALCAHSRPATSAALVGQATFTAAGDHGLGWVARLEGEAKVQTAPTVGKFSPPPVVPATPAERVTLRATLVSSARSAPRSSATITAVPLVGTVELRI